jgi:hypothetical protein
MGTEHFRLKPEHPSYQKIEKLFDFMDELGLTIETDRLGRVLVHDGTLPAVYLMDLESFLGDYDQTIPVLPPSTEWKLVASREVAVK